MAGEDTKDEQDALDALEVEAKEFDKVSHHATRCQPRARPI